MRQILVLRGGALGDFIVTLPALALLRSQWPRARLELAGNARAARLALNRGLLDAVHSQDEARWSALFSTSELPADFGRWLDGFDLVVSFWPDPDRALAGRFPRSPAQTFLSGTAKPVGPAPAAAHFCEPLRSLGLAPAGYFFPLAPGASPDRESTAAPRIAVHPGSGSPGKNWPMDRWREVCKWLQAKYKADLLIVSGDAESQAPLPDLGSQARGLPLEELAGLLAGCHAFLGHDSGVSHLAAACGAPCLLLFGPTDPSVWAPPAPHVVVVRKGPDLGAISVADVQNALETFLSGRIPQNNSLPLGPQNRLF
jgi:heptosyltransferase III